MIDNPQRPKQLPGGLLVLLVLATLHGVTGVISSAATTFETTSPDTSAGMLEESWTTVAKVFDIDDPWISKKIGQLGKNAFERLQQRNAVNKALAVFNIFLSLGLLVGAVLVLRGKKIGIIPLQITCIAHLPFEAVREFLLYQKGTDIIAAIDETFPGLEQPVMNDFVRANLGVVVFLLLSYLVFYAWLAIYLKRDIARKYCIL